jgi:hypothetical protein
MDSEKRRKIRAESRNCTGGDCQRNHQCQKGDLKPSARDQTECSSALTQHSGILFVVADVARRLFAEHFHREVTLRVDLGTYVVVPYERIAVEDLAADRLAAELPRDRGGP